MAKCSVLSEGVNMESKAMGGIQLMNSNTTTIIAFQKTGVIEETTKFGQASRQKLPTIFMVSPFCRTLAQKAYRMPPEVSVARCRVASVLPTPLISQVPSGHTSRYVFGENRELYGIVRFVKPCLMCLTVPCVPDVTRARPTTVAGISLPTRTQQKSNTVKKECQ